MDKVWRSLNGAVGPMAIISELINRYEWKNPDSLTSVREGPALIVITDYSYILNSNYESLSFLIADLAFIWVWDESRTRIRNDILKDNRRISFKRLSDNRRKRALIPFLRASNTIPGLLITFLLDKRIINRFSEPYPADKTVLGEYSKWKKKSYEKLTRVGHLGAMLIACLSAPDQEILWFTDKDEIAPNNNKIIEANKIIAHLLGYYLPHDIKKLRFGTTQSDDGTHRLEDLTSLPDLAAGALSNAFAKFRNEYRSDIGKVFMPWPYDLPWKTKVILSWLSEQDYSLKKLVVCVDFNKDKGYTIKTVNLNSYSS